MSEKTLINRQGVAVVYQYYVCVANGKIKVIYPDAYVVKHRLPVDDVLEERMSITSSTVTITRP